MIGARRIDMLDMVMVRSGPSYGHKIELPPVSKEYASTVRKERTEYVVAATRSCNTRRWFGVYSEKRGNTHFQRLSVTTQKTKLAARKKKNAPTERHMNKWTNARCRPVAIPVPNRKRTSGRRDSVSLLLTSAAQES